MDVEAPLDRLPVFVKAGSVIPMKKGLMYADEENGNPLEIHVYPGKDAKFTLYEDEGNNYRYESGSYAITDLIWDEAAQRLMVGETVGGFPGMEKEWREKMEVHIHGTDR